MWYDTPIEVQKMLMLLIAKSQKPSELTIAKFYVINLENFGAVRMRKNRTTNDNIEVTPRYNKKSSDCYMTHIVGLCFKVMKTSTSYCTVMISLQEASEDA